MQHAYKTNTTLNIYCDLSKKKKKKKFINFQITTSKSRREQREWSGKQDFSECMLLYMFNFGIKCMLYIS